MIFADLLGLSNPTDIDLLHRNGSTRCQVEAGQHIEHGVLTMSFCFGKCVTKEL